ncbi:MAG: M14 family zinc carboxypeptidase, partial [Acidobacteria bacterium]|nr:M14 family zinc carboxypeptidase [Acidobacteriota bacterium]
MRGPNRLLLTCLLCLLPALSFAQELWPGTRYDPKIPTLQSVVGWDHGEEISSPDAITTYLKALHAAAPDRTQLIEYARSWQNRPLHVLVIGSPARISQLDTIKRGMQRLADPRGVPQAELDQLVRDMPVITWLFHSVHGNEISGADAALAEAYHLLAAQGSAEVDTVLRESLVLIDPTQNPDGRA